MTKRPCLDCGTPTDGSYCRKHRKSTAQRGYDAEWQEQSRAAIARHVKANGWICPGYRRAPHPSTDLTGDHVKPARLGGTWRDGIRVLCRGCNGARRGALAL